MASGPPWGSLRILPCLQASIKRQPLKAGDTVSVAATVFGIEWAKKEYPGDWRHRKLQGQVTGKAGAKWKLHFAADGTTIVLPRQDITFIARLGPTADDKSPVDVDSSDKEAAMPEAGGARKRAAEEAWQREESKARRCSRAAKRAMEVDTDED